MSTQAQSAQLRLRIHQYQQHQHNAYLTARKQYFYLVVCALWTLCLGSIIYFVAAPIPTYAIPTNTTNTAPISNLPPSSSFIQTRGAKPAKIIAISDSQSQHTQCRKRWQWPLEHEQDNIPTILRHFEKPPAAWLAGHRGIDIEVQEHETVIAPAQGVIRYAGIIAGVPTVSIQHQEGVVSSYQPVQLLPSLHIGSAITQRETFGIIALTQSSAMHCTQCLHWGVFMPEHPPQYRNPMHYIEPKTIVLKPYEPRG